MRLAALIQKPRHGADVLSAGQVLELATAGGARALGLEQELGAIAVGRRADLVVLDLRGPHLAPTPPDPVSHLVYAAQADRKSTRLNSSHLVISYAVFCLKKKKQPRKTYRVLRPDTRRQTVAHRLI